MDEYLVPSQEGRAEFAEKRSRFIGHIFPVDTEEEALAQLKKMRETHWNANHNVYAYIIKDGATRYSDDSEPQGTAGMPVLEVLRREGVYNVLCVVTRYFGGVLLGAGGLIRAYAKGAKIGLDAAGLSMKRVWSGMDIACPYPLFERMKLEIEAYEGLIENVQYGADVLIHAIVPHGQSALFMERVVDVSKGKITPVVTDQLYKAFPLG